VVQFTLTDATGQKYNNSYDDEAGATLDGKVEPGSPLKGSLVYEVPAGVHDFRLAFAPELFSIRADDLGRESVRRDTICNDY
jgi:hypothetical protein